MDEKPPSFSDGWVEVCHVESPSKFFIRREFEDESFKR
jgi:hypothetical protein